MLVVFVLIQTKENTVLPMADASEYALKFQLETCERRMRDLQDELNQIAKVLNATYEQYFVLSNGERIR